MGRKKPTPQRIGEEKQVTWSMLDDSGQSSQQSCVPGQLTILKDNDPSLLREWEEAAKEGQNTTTDSNRQLTPLGSNICGNFVPENIRTFFRWPARRLALAKKTWSLRLPLYSAKHSCSQEVINGWHWQAGKFKVQFQGYDGLPMTSEVTRCLSSFEQCCLYIAHENIFKPIIYYEVYDEEIERESLAKLEEEENVSKFRKKQAPENRLGLFWSVDLEFASAWKFFQKFNRSGQKKFQLVCGEFDDTGKQFEVTVYGRKDSLQTLAHPSGGFVLRDVNHFLFEVMQHFYNLGPMYRRETPSLRQDFQELFEGVRALQLSQPTTVNVDVQHPCLKPLLRPYQRDAVLWMLQRERFCEQDHDNVGDDDLHPLYTEVKTHCGKTLYYNRQGGSLVMDKPQKMSSPPGGILADEMGLGKTVEVLCCVLLHQRPAIPLPSRLPTLTEIVAEKENNSIQTTSACASSLGSNLHSFGTASDINNSESVGDTLKSVVSSSSFRVTEDHTYCSMPHRENAASTSSTLATASHVPNCSDTVTTCEDVQPPSVLEARSNSSDKDENVGILSATDLQPQTKKSCSTSRKKNAEVKGKKHESGNAQTAAGKTPKRRLSKPSGGGEGTETEEAGEVQPQKKHKNGHVRQAAKKRRLAKSTELEDGVDEEVQPRKKCKKGGARSVAGRKNSDRSTEAAKGVDAEETYKVQSKKKCKKGQVRRAKKKGASEAEKGTKTEKSSEEKKRRSSRGYFEYVTDDEFYNYCCRKTKLFRKQQLFICVCGNEKSDQLENTVQCTECGTSQHAKCMNYDLEDPFRGPYKCPHCHYSGQPLPSGTTLIISPSSIAHQWIEEIQHHIHDQENNLRVFEYTGSKLQGFIQPEFLARHDIVVTTYETLRSELNYVDLKHVNSEDGKCLRNPKRFLAQPTPLTAVEWWRICLDEAQMVESVTTKTAEMALRLSCINRWCVTGTPLNQSIKDLFGLLAFIGYDPYCVEEWWTKFLYEPYLQGIKEPMFKTLAKVMWRNCMKDVKDQLKLPDISETLKCLTFSPVEDVFYRRLYHNCMFEISKSNISLSEEEKSKKLRKLDAETVNKFLNPLGKLRQACCHPQAVSGSKLSMKNSNLTMEELLDNLIKKSGQECVESHRSMIAAMNAQAGIYLIQDPPMVAEAVEKYREVLRSVEDLERQKQLKTDALPVIHAMHNLNKVLATNPPGVGRTLRDDQLGARCEELKKQYFQKTSSTVAACQDQLAPIQKSIQELNEQLPSYIGWCEQVLMHANRFNQTERLLQKVYDSRGSYYRSVITYKFRDLAGMQYTITKGMDMVTNSRKRVLHGIQTVERNRSNPSAHEKVIRCCLRNPDRDPMDIPDDPCVFCKVKRPFRDLESHLFPVESKRPSLDQMSGIKENQFECLLRNLLSYAKSQQMDKGVIKDGTTLLSLFELWKKEFVLMGSLFTELLYEVAAVDEVEMAVTRMRLRLPGEVPSGRYDINTFAAVELQTMQEKFASDEKNSASMLRSHCGQLDYLRNLAKAKCGEFKDGINPEMCPICRSELGRNWSVMQCGHCFCMSCIQESIKHSQVGRRQDFAIKCGVCREKTLTSELSYVSTSRSDASSCNVKGSHSSKVAAIVQCLMDIKKEDPEAKALVFATWSEVLRLIGQALQDNDIKFTHLFEQRANFQDNVSLFKTDKTVGALLLPYASGSKGLNLTEANHVLLVEPIYSLAEEAQAVGRIMRMGQTKPMKIHRFLVKRTIEERIHSLMEHTLRPQAKTNTTCAEKGSITLGELMSLFEDVDSCTAGPSGVTDVTEPDSDIAVIGHDSVTDVTRPGNVTDVTVPDSATAVTGHDSATDATGPDSATDATGHDSVTDATGSDSVTDATGPDSVTDATGPDSVTDATGCDSVTDATGCDSVTDATGHDSVTDATGHDSVTDATGPDSVTDATGPDSVTDAKVPDSVTDATGHDSATDATGHDSATDATGRDSITDATGYDSATDVTVHDSVTDVQGPYSVTGVTEHSSVTSLTEPSNVTAVSGPCADTSAIIETSGDLDVSQSGTYSDTVDNSSGANLDA